MTLFFGTLEFGDYFDLAAGILSLVLFAIAIYAWYLRRQTPLLLMAIGFLAFSGSVLIQLQPGEGLAPDVFAVSLQILFLLLFFAALLVRPRAKTEPEAA
jgi:hypothetical protein